MNNTPESPKSHSPESPARTPRDSRSLLRTPSVRVTAALAAAMLGIGVAVGAAIGPAPAPSQADSSLPVLLTTLARGAAARAAAAQAAAAAASAAQSAPSAEAASTRKRHRREHKHASAEEASSTSAATETETTTPASTTPATTTPTGSKGTGKAAPLPPVTHVWLIELAGTSFASALAQPAAAPYIDTQAIPAGTLLSGWSALAGGAFANETALLASSPPQLLDTIVQPPCPEVEGAACTGEAGELSAADGFLEATVPTITSTADFRESGLIVVTFASIGSATASGLPAGAASATLTATPPAGVLLISPFASVGARSSAAFNPTSPKQSLEKLLRR
jgi:hypothetical protein